MTCANFRTLVHDVVPLTGWWQRFFRTEVLKRIVGRKIEDIDKRELAEIQKRSLDKAFD